MTIWTAIVSSFGDDVHRFSGACVVGAAPVVDDLGEGGALAVIKIGPV